MKSWQTYIVCTVLAFVLPLTIYAQDARAPLLGTWTLNVARSKYQPGPAPKSSTSTSWTFAQTPAGIQLSVTANGATQTNSIFKLDGKPYPMRGGSAIDAHALTQTSRLETKSNLMRGGKVVGHATIVVAKDLKSMTVENSYTTPAGQAVHNVMVFDKR